MSHEPSSHTHTVELTYRPDNIDHDIIDRICLEAAPNGYHHVLPRTHHNRTVNLLGQTDTDTFEASVTIAIGAIGDADASLGAPVGIQVWAVDEFDRQAS